MTEEMRRNRILDAAEQRFLVDGFERSSVDAIAADARVSKREIYRDWPSKSDLFAAVALRTFPEIEVAPIALDGGANAEPMLEQLALQLLDIFVADRNRSFFRTSIAATRHFPDLISEMHQRRTTAWAGYGACFEQLGAAGIIDAPDAAKMALRFGSLAVEGARFLFGSSPPSGAARRQYAHAVVHLFFNGWESAQNALGQDSIAPELRLPVAVDLPDEIMPLPTMRMPAERFTALREALWNEFLTNGYPRANMGRAAASAGVSKATVYRQFVNKEGVFSYLASDAIIALQQVAWCDHTPSGEAFEQDLEALMHAMLEAHVRPEMLALQRMLVEEASIFPQLARAFYDTQLGNAKHALTQLCTHYGKREPTEIFVRLFYVLVTFGSRFLMTLPAPAAEVRTAIICEAMAVFTRGVAKA